MSLSQKDLHSIKTIVLDVVSSEVVKIERRFDEVDRKFDALKEKFDKRFDELDSRLTVLE